MTTAASGCLSLNDEALRNTLAACAAFQDLVGAANAAAAAERIYLEALPLPGIYSDTYNVQDVKDLRPYALLYIAENGLVVTRDSATNSGQVSGTHMLEIWDNIPVSIAENIEESDRRFKNVIGNILASYDSGNPGLRELLGTSGYKMWNTITLEHIYRATKEQYPDLGDCQGAYLRIEWGVV